jgi:hypothetical protein
MALAPTTAPSRPCKLERRGFAPLGLDVADALAAEPEPELLAVALGELLDTGGGYVAPWAFISNVVLVYTCEKRMKTLKGSRVRRSKVVTWLMLIALVKNIV